MAEIKTNPKRLLIAATQSGSGKTTITCGLIHALKKRGLKVQGYKSGPDYIDPGYLRLASGRPVHNLDTWLLKNETMKSLFAEHANKADITIVEGVMGLFDGGRDGISSSASIAKELKIPVILVINVAAMAESAAAIALGFREYDKDVNVVGVIINNAASEKHSNMVRTAMERRGIKVFGTIFRNKEMQIKERHLGLLPTDENNNKELVKIMSDEVEKSLDIETILEIASNTEEITVKKAETSISPKVKIAVAKDRAFSFYYEESLAEMERNGAELIYFSPLTDSRIPEADGLLLGGGFPEMFARELSENTAMKSSIKKAVESGMPTVAECGGFIFLTDSITNFKGETYKMCGIIPAKSKMTPKLRRMGYVTANSLRKSVLTEEGTYVQGHEFHFSEIIPNDTNSFPYAWEFHGNCGLGATYKGGYTKNNITASYLHLHFSGYKNLLDKLITSCEKYKKSKNII